MKVKDVNSSSKKTKQAIKDSFIDLLYEKGSINKIKVTELVKRANIDRTTFYSHYDNIYGLVNDFEEEFLEVLDSEFEKINSLDDLFLVFDKLTFIGKTNEEKYRMVASSDFNSYFYKNINIKLKNVTFKIMSNIKPDMDKDELYFKVCVFIDGFFIQANNYYSNKDYDHDFDYITENAKKILKSF